MYGKLFESMYDGTLGSNGPWQALVTFQQLIILADANGVVDMTAQTIARRTTIPLEIIEVGLAALEQPDPDSRTPDHGGRRIVRLSDSRSWGWEIVNHARYRAIRSQEERRAYMRDYQSARRARLGSANSKQALTPVNKVTHAVSSMQEAEAILPGATGAPGGETAARQAPVAPQPRRGRKGRSIPPAEGESQPEAATGWTAQVRAALLDGVGAVPYGRVGKLLGAANDEYGTDLLVRAAACYAKHARTTPPRFAGKLGLRDFVERVGYFVAQVRPMTAEERAAQGFEAPLP